MQLVEQKRSEIAVNDPMDLGFRVRIGFVDRIDKNAIKDRQAVTSKTPPPAIVVHNAKPQRLLKGLSLVELHRTPDQLSE